MWTSQLIDVLKGLLEKGANPTMLNKNTTIDLRVTNREMCLPFDDFKESALITFFRAVPIIIARHQKLVQSMFDLLPFFLTETCLNHKEGGRSNTILHALMNWNWQLLPDGLPVSFSEHFARVCTRVVKLKPALKDTKNENNETPLHLLAPNVYAHPEIGQEVEEIFKILATKKNVNMADREGRTPFYWISACKQLHSKDSALSKIQKILTKKGAYIELGESSNSYTK